jgi:FkbM family methyltransferase
MISRFFTRTFSRYPRTYLSFLRFLRRGSIEKRVFLSVLRAGYTVFDVGANRGNFTLLFSDIVRLNGRVFAFEPVPLTLALLEKAIAGCNNCEVHNVALGNASGKVFLHLPGTDDGQASMRQHNHGSWTAAQEFHRHECRMITLDEIAANLTRLDFIKCDVEGAELLVLQGARSTLERLAPILFLEVFDEWTLAFDYTPADLVCFLRNIGYSIIFLVSDSVRPLRDPSEINGSVNLLCAKPGMLPNVLEV